MHRTYSLRNSRAPTASQLQNPPPPPSTTKGRFFGKGGLAYSFRRSAAGAFGPELSRKLSQLVKIEKNVLRSMELTANERRDAAKQLSIWGLENDDDVSDITDKLCGFEKTSSFRTENVPSETNSLMISLMRVCCIKSAGNHPCARYRESCGGSSADGSR